MANELFAQVGPRTVQTASAAPPAPATRRLTQPAPAVAAAEVADSRQTKDVAGGKEVLSGGKTEQEPGDGTAQGSDKALSESISQLNHYVQNLNREIQFSVDVDSKKTIIKVIDANTGEVIRQMPPDEMMRLVKRLDELDGLLVREKA